ncbi:MAG: peptidase domain-containing ABC transporter [Clostridia bacterium]|nr:peptidase domain-containing ABC transporter [Clostridia bacterium]
MRIVKQHDIKDCGAVCLSMICRHYKLKLPIARFRELIKVDNNGANIYGLVNGADKLGLKATALQGNADEFIESVKRKEFSFPIIARVIIDEILEHYIVIYKITNRYIYVADPGSGKKKYKFEEFFNIWTGHIVTFVKTANFKEVNECKGTLTRFVKLVTNQKKLLVVVFFISLLISLIGVLGAFIFQIIIDGIETQQTNGFLGMTLGQICVGIIILYLFQMVINVLRGYFLSVLSKNVDLPLMLNYYNHIVDLPIKHLNGRKTGELMSRFNDASSIKEAISSATLSLMLDTLMVVLCVFILYALNHVLFFITLFTVLAYAIVVICFLNPIKNINEKIMKENAEVTSYLKESVDGIETVKAFGAENIIKKKASDKVTKFVKNTMKGSIIYTTKDSLSGVVSSIGIIILLWIGTNLVMNNVISLGTLITFYSLLGYFLDPIQSLINLQPELQTAVVAADRLNDILDLETECKTTEKVEFENNIDIKNVSFRYGNRELVLQNVYMSIKQGETVALIGESGSGKTTLAKLIMAFYEPEEGQILIGGKNIAEVNPRSVRENIAYISQDVFLFSDSIKNNLTLGNKNIPMEEIEKACKLSMADEFIKKMPMGYNTLLGENGHDLSGGQKQRLAIARALLKNPKILIMDEATSNLDTITEQSIKETIDNLSGNITCIIIAHRLSTIKNCDKIYVMDRGMVVECGNHDDLIKKNGLYKKFCASKCI